MSIDKSQVRTLMVEDQDLSQIIFKMTLRKLGYASVEIVGNGKEVVRKAEEYRPHLILMDTNLPGMMGYDACKAVREQP